MQRDTEKFFGFHPGLPFVPFDVIFKISVHNCSARDSVHYSINVPDKTLIFFARFYFREFPTHY